MSKCSSIGESMNSIEKKWNQKVTNEMITQERRRMSMGYGIINGNSLEEYSVSEERGGKEKRSSSVAYCCLDGECGRSVRPGL